MTLINEAIEIRVLWPSMCLFPSECLEVKWGWWPSHRTWSSLSARCCQEECSCALWELDLAIADTTDPVAFENLGQSRVSSQVSLLPGWGCKQEVASLGTRSRKGILLVQEEGKRHSTEVRWSCALSLCWGVWHSGAWASPSSAALLKCLCGCVLSENSLSALGLCFRWMRSLLCLIVW